MSETLGKLEKPAAETFQDKRKLYLVTLLFTAEEAPQEYVEKFNRYWEEVDQQIAGLEAKLGRVGHVYHESIYLAGEDGLILLDNVNAASCRLAKDKCQSGAVLEATEDKELAEEAMDWARFIYLGFVSQKVSKIVTEFYLQSLKKRYEHIARVIDQTLKPNDAGVLFITEGHMVQFAKDIEVISIAPPALDDIRRWQRNRPPPEKEEQKDKEKKKSD